MRKPWGQIKWTKASAAALQPKGAVLLEAAGAALGPPSAAMRFSLREAVAEVGVPSVAGSPLDEARVLLAAASEVEHSLLVQYLYATWSLGSNPIANRVRTLAIQEMCHLLTVQNLLLFVGALPYLQRTAPTPDPGADPFPFALRPLTQGVLEDYLLAEMPALKDLSEAQQTIIQPVIDRHVQQQTPVNRVGVIYAHLYWLFQQDDQPAAGWPEVAQAGFPPGRHIPDFPGMGSVATTQADPDAEPEWNASDDRDGVFAKIDSRQAALDALAAIAAQGEGLASNPNGVSHFGTFLNIFTTADLTKLPIVPLPVNPFVAPQPDPDPTREANRITHSMGGALCTLFDIRYRILLAAIRAALSVDRSGSGQTLRSQYTRWALEEMQSTVKGLARTILRFPCKNAGSTAILSAAPTFSLQGFALPAMTAELDELLRSLHRSAADAITAIEQLNPDVGVNQILQQIKTVDQQRFPNP